MEKYFYCYSYPLKEFMIKNGVSPILSSIHEKTQKKFWVFKSGKEVSRVLDMWRENRPAK